MSFLESHSEDKTLFFYVLPYKYFVSILSPITIRLCLSVTTLIILPDTIASASLEILPEIVLLLLNTFQSTYSFIDVLCKTPYILFDVQFLSVMFVFVIYFSSTRPR